jgi:hypothetical protein
MILAPVEESMLRGSACRSGQALAGFMAPDAESSPRTAARIDAGLVMVGSAAARVIAESRMLELTQGAKTTYFNAGIIVLAYAGACGCCAIGRRRMSSCTSCTCRTIAPAAPHKPGAFRYNDELY